MSFSPLSPALTITMTTSDTNLYAAPQAEVADTTASPGGYYVVAPKKFWTLFIATLGLYQAYWFYKHWALYRARSDEKLWPVARTIFAIFFAHNLFRKIDADANSGGRHHEWSAGSTATAYVILVIAERIFDKLAGRGVGSPLTDLLSLVAILLVGITLYRAQLAANVASDDPAGEGNAAFTGGNYVWLALGGVFWILTLIGLFAGGVA